MPISKGVLGMNARNFNYIQKYNDRRFIRLVDNKIRTKRLLKKNRIPTAKLFSLFKSHEDARNFDWSKLPKEGFVIKPSRGYGGSGILAFRNWDGEKGKTVFGDILTIAEIEAHVFDILEGSYSIQNLPDVAYVEELLSATSFFKKLTRFGLPDIRVIVFNRIPVMAMMRLPTIETGGKANLHMGAVGVGISIRTGITTNAIFKNKTIKYIPHTKLKVRGRKIPNWNQILVLAAKAQEASKLGYAGVDVVVDAKKGALVLEINARPGLAIQSANKTSLRTRLELVENVPIANIERAIEIAKSLFAEDHLDNVKTENRILSVLEDVTIFTKEKNIQIKAKVDTGAYRTSIDWDIVRELNIKPMGKKIHITAASGEENRPAVKLKYELSGKNISTIANIADRAKLSYPMIIGRRDLKGFLVDPIPQEEFEDIEEFWE